MFEQALLEAVKASQRCVVLTGAGVSAESGIPTFRDSLTSLWALYDPTVLASAEGFIADPSLVWGWYEWRRNAVLCADPNPAHVALAQLQHYLPKLTLLTQNVDDLHERAGSTTVQHLHGSLHAPRCIACSTAYTLPIVASVIKAQPKRIEPPRCTVCAELIRPGVVWFGEALPSKVWFVAERAIEHCDLLLCIGTSGLVYPVADLPHLALRANATVVNINPEASALDSNATFTVRGKAGVVLPQLVCAAFHEDSVC